MAILSNFEIIVLTPTYHTAPNGIVSTTWQPLKEFDPPSSKITDPSYAVDCHRYVGVSPVEKPFPGEVAELSTEFAIDFKTTCGFNFIDCPTAEYLVFRVYLDDIKIGSAFIKRQRWERSGSYRVRKTGRRHWVHETQCWIEQKWAFDRGLHGTLKIELWRECDRPASSGSWDHPDFLPNTMSFGNCIDLTCSPTSPGKSARVRHTAKVDEWAMTTFVFEYRSEATLAILGLLPHSETESEEADQANGSQDQDDEIQKEEPSEGSPAAGVSPNSISQDLPVSDKCKRSFEHFETEPIHQRADPGMNSTLLNAYSAPSMCIATINSVPEHQVQPSAYNQSSHVMPVTVITYPVKATMQWCQQNQQQVCEEDVLEPNPYSTSGWSIPASTGGYSGSMPFDNGFGRPSEQRQQLSQQMIWDLDIENNPSFDEVVDLTTLD